MLAPLIAEEQIYGIFDGRAKLYVDNRGFCARCIGSHPLKYASHFIRSFFRKHFDQTNMSEFIKNNDQQPLFFDHCRKYIFFHALLEKSTKVFFSQEFSNMTRGGKCASQQRT